MRYGNSFPVNSTKTERAAVALDMMMNDPEINMLLVYGFEGEHYIPVSYTHLDVYKRQGSGC